MLTIIVSTLFMVLGFVLVKRKVSLGQKAASYYQKIGLQVPEDLYAKQFMFVGVLLMIVGFLGITGLLLAYPMASSRIIPGWGLNIAFWVHRIEAILAMAHVFIIHFFIGHLRRHNFPMDMAMFEGSVDLEKTREEKPAWIERLQKAGKLNQLLVSENRKRIRILFYTIGYAAVAIGVFLLIGGIINSPYITW